MQVMEESSLIDFDRSEDLSDEPKRRQRAHSTEQQKHGETYQEHVSKVK